MASVLEIGPGPGVLTQRLAKGISHVTALEIDPRYVRLLAETAPTATILPGDALQADLGEILRSMPAPRAIVSNLPYYITSPLLQRIADVRQDLDLAVLMMQKEVAARIAAQPGESERGSLSVYLQAHFEIQGVRDVPAGCFLPPPKVDSRVLSFVPTRTETSESVFRLVRLGFAQPRKTLANNLATGLRIERDRVIDVLEALGMQEKSRAQELSIDQWKAISARLEA